MTAVIDVQNLQTYFHIDRGVVKAVDDISFQIDPGHTLGVVGESGSGKSVTSLTIMRLLAATAQVHSGSISFLGQDLVGLPEKEMRKIRGAEISMIFQEPGTSLNPVYRTGDQVMEAFSEHLGVNVIRVDAEEAFLSALEGESDPENKRKIIGRKFIEVFEAQAKELDGVRWLAQGTIYPDVIESAGAATGKAHVIKSHHNVGGLPEQMNLKLIEPLRDLFKDEVRKIGVELGLPPQLVGRHPFPGPGLGVRILGLVKKEYADVLRRADDIFISELREQGLYDKVSQAFAVFLPVKSVGVMGDGRRYDYVVALRAVETVDFMTARWAHLPYDFLDHVSRRIINEIQGISRVTYDISGKPPATIEWE